MNKKFQVIGVFTGVGAKLSNGIESAIKKIRRDSIRVTQHGIEGDSVVNRKYHGGDMRVIHHYSQENYQHLKERFPEIASRFIPGSFGENLLTKELTETDLNIGDIYSLGTAKIQLTVCRRPCATLNYGYEDERVLKEIIRSGRTGWFYRVLEEGVVQEGDYLSLLESPFPDLPVSKLHDQGYGLEKFSDLDFLRRCYDTGLMDKGWKPKLQDVLDK
ncbi:MAG: MOSC domain-containing protein [Bdellovibrio sp. CG12_big_fil_rev_8_21_14_0_65_39_13]|nr:MAG: MOSC domain-containing protein [Bdellovibrio sp. CG22_combo_CG10-13_8_21_14_all_39_27]PIQ59024.1 MAG: MOSC domain-containing protein [Bdellovibrio sp. CG12_big_fil_rev_8_21_14_0_65_39_13]PIR33000.1 MAG: MOSC domain-containing protein [Bdellovibrio sp. CG11_big_fil_rev_8_21_14_0_20_39_38]